MENKVGRNLPLNLMQANHLKPFTTTKIGHPLIQAVAPKILVNNGTSKVISSLKKVIKTTVKDGMTISFHHHLREGDYIFNLVMREIMQLGIKNLTLAPSSLSNVMNDVTIQAIKNGTVTHLTTSGMRGTLGEAISHGLMRNPVIFRSHGGRARAIETGVLKIDVAFLGVPNADRLGNANGIYGKSAFGSLGYALVDAQYANKVVLLTDDLKPYPNTPVSIKQTQVDYVVQIDKLGDPNKIGSGATRFTNDPKELKIAQTVSRVITNSPYFKNNFSFQTGSGGAALAVTRYLRQAMLDKKVVASFGLGGITQPMVNLLDEGLVEVLMDVQDFDKGAAQSMAQHPAKQQEISAAWYADPFLKGSMVSQLDVVVLSALDIDTNFNVNALTGDDGIIRGAIGGHQDAGMAKLTIIAAPLVRGRIPTVVKAVTTIVTPGSSIDVLVTDQGVAVNPNRPDLIACLKQLPNFELLTIEELQQKATKIVGKAAPLTFTNHCVGLVEYRNGTIIDAIYETKD